LKREEIYTIIKDFLEKREDKEIILTKEGLVVKRAESDYVIKVVKKKS
jgi:hypothetical protein